MIYEKVRIFFIFLLLFLLWSDDGVIDPEQDGNLLETIYMNWKKTSMKNANLTQEALVVWAIGRVYGYTGLHLYRCWQCNRVLLKPLQCGQCKSVAYCRYVSLPSSSPSLLLTFSLYSSV